MMVFTHQHPGLCGRRFFRPVLQGAGQRQGHILGHNGLGHEIPGAVLEGDLRAVLIPCAGDDDDFGGRCGTGDLLHETEPVAIRQGQVKEHHIKSLLGAGLKC